MNCYMSCNIIFTDGIVEVQLFVKSNQSQSISERLAADKLAQTLVPQPVEEDDDDNLHPGNFNHSC